MWKDVEGCGRMWLDGCLMDRWSSTHSHAESWAYQPSFAGSLSKYGQAMASRDSTIKSDVPGNVGSIKTWVPIWRSMTWTLAFQHPSVLGGNVNYFVHLLTRNYPFGKLVWVFLCYCFKAISTKWKVSWCWDHRTITVDFFKSVPLVPVEGWRVPPCWKCQRSP